MWYGGDFVEIIYDKYIDDKEMRLKCWTLLRFTIPKQNGKLAYNYTFEKFNKRNLKSGFRLKHKCGTPNCFNPYHLSEIKDELIPVITA